ncbi:chalcone isomerase family protein [Shimia marina]|uniref:Chalcone isomerase domain-containing protein n=1 Tax=Shimia marina TaxID=321267 RepID=A0A0P1EQ86_9RHOB|nr:chalcone isomerase family protein [Shimia marina]CUH52327.1 hypothetical protein SHM7688_01773 [Shimia marina]SFE08825.1 hypothetical protein SAMN04488037_10595 [Shimia marina]
MHVRLPIRERVLMAALALAVALGYGASVKADTGPDAAPEVRSLLGAPQAVGAGQFRYLGLKVYDAQMFAPQGQGFEEEGLYALEIEYARKIRRAVLLRASLSEMERIEGARSDHAEIMQKLEACYRDIRPGDRIVAAPEASDALKFWVNGTRTCTLRHRDIRDRYMAIWLSDKARDRQFAQQVMAARN